MISAFPRCLRPFRLFYSLPYAFMRTFVYTIHVLALSEVLQNLLYYGNISSMFWKRLCRFSHSLYLFLWKINSFISSFILKHSPPLPYQIYFNNRNGVVHRCTAVYLRTRKCIWVVSSKFSCCMLNFHLLSLVLKTEQRRTVIWSSAKIF